MGEYSTSGTNLRTLIERWNGATWSQVPSPDLGTFDALLGVAASGPSTVWTVGTYDTGGPNQTLAFHCC